MERSLERPVAGLALSLTLWRLVKKGAVGFLTARRLTLPVAGDRVAFFVDLHMPVNRIQM